MVKSDPFPEVRSLSMSSVSNVAKVWVLHTVQETGPAQPRHSETLTRTRGPISVTLQSDFKTTYIIEVGKLF